MAFTAMLPRAGSIASARPSRAPKLGRQTAAPQLWSLGCLMMAGACIWPGHRRVRLPRRAHVSQIGMLPPSVELAPSLQLAQLVDLDVLISVEPESSTASPELPISVSVAVAQQTHAFAGEALPRRHARARASRERAAEQRQRRQMGARLRATAQHVSVPLSFDPSCVRLKMQRSIKVQITQSSIKGTKERTCTIGVSGCHAPKERERAKEQKRH